MAEIVVGIADCRTGNVPGQVLATYALGSCIGLAIYDPGAEIGGLLHFMLPDSTIASARGRENPYMFADTGIPLLLKSLYDQGAQRRRLVAQAVGGAQIMDPRNIFEIGKRNYQAMRRILWKAGILLQDEAIGGVQSRTVRLQIGTGRVWLQEGSEHREMTSAGPRKGGSSWHIAS